MEYIHKKFECYYPIVDSSLCDIYEMLFNCCVYPRVSNECQTNNPIHLFRCAVPSANFLANRKFTAEKNHSFPLIDHVAENPCYQIPSNLDFNKNDILVNVSSSSTIPNILDTQCR